MFASKENGRSFKCSSTLAILQQIAKLTYLQNILFGATAEEALQIVSWVQLAEHSSTEELLEILGKHLELRTFLVGRHVTAADLIVVMPVLQHLSVISDFERLQAGHVFRWADHIQNLRGVREEVERAQIFAAFPDSNSKPPSKSELKKLAKLKAAQEKKQNKKAGNVPEESKEKPAESKKDVPAKEELKKEEKP